MGPKDKGSNGQDEPAQVSRERSPFLRCPPGGIPFEVKPSIFEETRSLLATIKRPATFQALTSISPAIHYFVGGPSIAPDHTWTALLKELFVRLKESANDTGLEAEFVVSLLEVITGCSTTAELWGATRAMLVSHTSTLAGRLADPSMHLPPNWASSGFRDDDQSQIRVYWPLRNLVDQIEDDLFKEYGTLRALLRAIALYNITLDYQASPKDYPAKLVVYLPDQGWTGNFLSWRWFLDWPDLKQPLNWRPNNNCCDPLWLAFDLFSAMSEAITGSGELSDSIPENPGTCEGVFFEKFRGASRQYEVSLETDLVLGPNQEEYLEFEGKTFRWINGTYGSRALLITASEAGSFESAASSVQRLISWLAWLTDIPIRVKSSVEAQLRLKPWLVPSRGGGAVAYSPEYLRLQPYADEKRRMGVSIYREGVNAESPYYKFFSFYKVVQLPFDGKGKGVAEWIDSVGPKVNAGGVVERVHEIRDKGVSLSDHLYAAGRNAIAHVNHEPRMDPDNPEDTVEFIKDARLVQAFAKAVIRDDKLWGAG